MRINKDYITSLQHPDENKSRENRIKPVGGMDFIEALEAAFPTAADKTVNFLLNAPSTYSGSDDFKKRVSSAIVNNEKLSIDDQKYIADLTHKVSLGIFKIPKEYEA
jgi:hypothetical protein